MDIKQYRDDPAINYSLLSAFNDNPDKAGEYIPDNNFFEFGKAIELRLVDRLFNKNSMFNRFFISSVTVHKDIPELIKNKSDLGNEYIYKGDGSLNNKHKNKHKCIDECIQYQGMMPLSQFDYMIIEKSIDSLLKLKVDLPGCEPTTLSEVLPRCKFQVPLFWEKDGIKKKALLDILLEYGDFVIPFDLKSAASFLKFKEFLKNKYWIQREQYTEGCQECFVDKEVVPMSFLVCSKSESDSYYAGQFDIKSWDDEHNKICYDSLVDRFVEWDKNGRNKLGYKEREAVKTFVEYKGE
jgi:hypothetical protein